MPAWSRRPHGLERRGPDVGVEIKGLVESRAMALTTSPFVGPVEIWCKWTASRLELPAGSTLAVAKRRMLRTFDATEPDPVEVRLDDAGMPLAGHTIPASGCNAELTRVSLPDGGVWWTFGLEAFGSLDTVERDLRKVAAYLASRRPPALDGALQASYPAWLRDRIRSTA